MTRDDFKNQLDTIFNCELGIDCHEQINALMACYDEQRDLIARLQLEAQIHAQEARAANATIAEIYQVVSGGTGEPGNWHGAEPVRRVIQEQREEITRLLDILRLFVNAVGEECRLDHHGYCQAHSLSDPCEVKLAKQALTQEPPKERHVINKREPPEWFGPALAAARHADEVATWPWLYRFLHRKLIACPACKYLKEPT